MSLLNCCVYIVQIYICIMYVDTCELAGCTYTGCIIEERISTKRINENMMRRIRSKEDRGDDIIPASASTNNKEYQKRMV